MPPGLLAAQVAHISDQFLRKALIDDPRDVSISDEALEWIEQPYITILAVNTLEELQAIAVRAIAAGLPTFEWNDTVVMPTLATAMKVLVGISIGPEDSDKLKAVTNDLPLL